MCKNEYVLLLSLNSSILYITILLAISHPLKCDIDDPKKTEHLLALDGAKERLHLFKANLLEEGAFDSAINGCDGVFHTAFPVIHSAIDPQVDICPSSHVSIP